MATIVSDNTQDHAGSSEKGTENNCRFGNFAFLGFSQTDENNRERLMLHKPDLVLAINGIRLYGILACKLSSPIHALLIALQKLQKIKIHIPISKF